MGVTYVLYKIGRNTCNVMQPTDSEVDPSLLLVLLPPMIRIKKITYQFEI